MRRLLFFLFVSIFGCCFMFAQTADINKIKKNRSYITAQAASTESLEAASEIAHTSLNLEIEQWLKDRGENDIAGYVAKSKESISVINTRQGSIFRSFVYVKKKEVLPFYQDEDVVMDSLTTASIIASQPVPEPQVRVDTLIMPAVSKDVPELIVNVNILYVITEAEQEMLKVKTFDEMTAYIKNKVEQNALSEDKYGKYATMPKQTPCHVFIYDKQGAIPACIRVTADEIVNLKTGEKDAISNYAGCGAFWFILNK